MLLYNEVFKEIEECPGYLVSNYGRVQDNQGNIIRTNHRAGYVSVNIGTSGNRTSVDVHRLVMMTFEPLDNCESMVVNHLDGDKTNNYIYNLEWCTEEDNRIHAGYFGLSKTYTPVYVCLSGKDTDIFFLSYKAAGKYLGVSKDKIAYALRFPNNQIHHPGFRIKHKDDEWLELDRFSEDKMTWTKTIQTNAVSIRNLQTGESFNVSSQSEAARIVGLSSAVVSLELSNLSNQRILPGWWQIKLLRDKWIFIEDIWFKYEQDNDNVRVIKMTDNDGNVRLFTSATECANYLGISKTNLNYNLTKKTGQRNKHGYIFEYYSDGVR